MSATREQPSDFVFDNRPRNPFFNQEHDHER